MKNKRTIPAALVLALVCAVSLSAQVKGALIVQSSVSGAQVYADGKLIGNAAPNFSIMLPARTYTIKVSKSGYQDYVQSVNLTSAGFTVAAKLMPLGQAPAPKPAPAPAPQPIPAPQPVPATLSVNANIQGAEVLINGNPAGRTPFAVQVTPGTYNVLVRAPGYNDFSQSLLVNGPSQVNANLQPSTATLSINSNIGNAEVFINNNPAGRTPFTAQVLPGSYNVLVRAPGYNDFNQTVLVNGPTQLNASLQATSYQLSIDSGSVRGAQVLINGNSVGQTPYIGMLPLGIYSLVVRAPGYSRE